MASSTDRDEYIINNGPLSDPGERRAVFAVLDSFRKYRSHAHYNTTHRRRQNLYALPQQHWSLLASSPFNMLDTLTAVDDAIDFNADIADAIMNLGLQVFGLPRDPVKGTKLYWHDTAKANDMVKAHSTVRQIYRDWSAVGFAAETGSLLRVILSDLKAVLPVPAVNQSPRILLPGAGLGRMLFELSLAGYSVEGNEISYHQLLTSNFILNATQRAEQFRLYPFVTSFVNNISRAHQLKETRIPDVHPATAIAEQAQAAPHGGKIGEMNMTAGDFITSYTGSENEATFDAILSVYFIDTAPNFLRYVETIKNCLKDGGFWINIGPLLWHFDDRQVGPLGEDRVHSSHKIDTEDTGIGEAGSFELTEEEVILLIKQLDFEIVHHDHLPETFGGYNQDPESMIQSRYRCSHWVARKLTRKHV